MGPVGEDCGDEAHFGENPHCSITGFQLGRQDGLGSKKRMGSRQRLTLRLLAIAAGNTVPAAAAKDCLFDHSQLGTLSVLVGEQG
jgi:hypothetical protein